MVSVPSCCTAAYQAGNGKAGSSLNSLYATDVQSALDSQQRRHVAEVAAEKNAWNDLFAAKLD